MKTLRLWLLALSLATPAARALAHEADHALVSVEARTSGQDNQLDARRSVVGTVSELKALLYRVEHWPELFSDVRSAAQNADGTWSIDFRRFGHAHDFHVVRTPGGVVLELAARDHGLGRLEFTLSPLDATHSLLALHFAIGTPAGFTSAQMRDTLKEKAATDLSDFAQRAKAHGESPLPLTAREGGRP